MDVRDRAISMDNPSASLTELGEEVSDLTPSPQPQRKPLIGTHITLEPLQAHHADSLYAHVGGSENASLWKYVSTGPFDTPESWRSYVSMREQDTEHLFFAIVNNETHQAVGHAALMRVDTANRVIEIGHILFPKVLQRTTAATEAVYLLLDYVFSLRYRRCEWKTHCLNAASRGAAIRFGFTFEGIFRQHMISKGRNRDSVWFSMLDAEWASIGKGFQAWLDAKNFDEQGKQLRRLGECIIDSRELSGNAPTALR